MASSLELFLLALIDAGLTSIYKLREVAGLSVGTTQPALHRLQSQNHIKKGAAGKRGRSDFALTPAGRATLNSGVSEVLNAALQKPPADMESVLRLVILASSFGDKAKAQKLLKLAQDQRSSRIKAITPSREHTPIATQYRTYLRIFESARLKAEKHALSHVRRQLQSSR